MLHWQKNIASVDDIFIVSFLSDLDVLMGQTLMHYESTLLFTLSIWMHFKEFEFSPVKIFSLFYFLVGMHFTKM